MFHGHTGSTINSQNKDVFNIDFIYNCLTTRKYDFLEIWVLQKLQNQIQREK